MRLIVAMSSLTGADYIKKFLRDRYGIVKEDFKKGNSLLFVKAPEQVGPTYEICETDQHDWVAIDPSHDTYKAMTDVFGPPINELLMRDWAERRL